jgi:hypothetical protein
VKEVYDTMDSKQLRTDSSIETVTTNLSQLTTQVSAIPPDYQLASYRAVFDECGTSGHIINGGKMLWECLNHNYA